MRQKTEEEKVVKLGISLSRRTYDALLAKTTEGPFKVKVSQIIETALMRFLELDESTASDPEAGK